MQHVHGIRCYADAWYTELKQYDNILLCKWKGLSDFDKDKIVTAS